MVRENRTRSSENSGYRVIIVLVALAAASSAIRDLNRLQDFASSVKEIASSLLENSLTVVYANNRTTEGGSCLHDDFQAETSSDRFRWSGRVAPGKFIEIKGINGGINAEPAAGNQVEVVADKKSHRSDPKTVGMKVVEHPGGVTICAIYPSDDPDQPNTCEPGGKGDNRNSSARINLRHNDVSVKHISGKIGSGGRELVLKTLNGSINLRRSG